MAAEPNILRASASVGLLDTNSPRSRYNRDPVQAHTRSQAEAVEAEGAQHNSHKRDKPDPRRHRRKSAIRQTRSFRPAREEQAISFSFFVLLAVGAVASNHRLSGYFAPALPDADVLGLLGVTINQARLRVADFHQYRAFMASGPPA